MKVLLSWIRDFVDVPGTAESIGELMSNRGLPLEGIAVDVDDAGGVVGSAAEIAAPLPPVSELPKRAFRCRQAVLAFSSMNEVHYHLGKSHESPGICIVGINFRDALTDADGCFRSPKIALTADDVVLSRHQEEIVSLDTLRPALFDGSLLFRQELEFQRLHDRFGDFILQRENVVEIAVITLRPDMISGCSVGQLSRDAHSISGAANTSLENIRDPEFVGDGYDFERLAFIGERRVARDYE